MGKRKESRLAFFGEYVVPDGKNNEEVYQARFRLIGAVRKVFPELLKELSEAVLPSYSQLAAAGKLAKEGYDFEKALWSDNDDCSPYGVLREGDVLKSALDKWAFKYNATESWILVGALRTLRDWHASPAFHESLTWNTLHGFSYTGTFVEDFEFSHPSWKVLDQQWPTYCKSLRLSLKKKLAEYETKVRKLAESRGLVQGQRTYSAKNLEWFVLYQFAGLSSSAIAHREPGAVDDSTVLKGIKTAKRLVAWGELRKPRARSNRKTR